MIIRVSVVMAKTINVNFKFSFFNIIVIFIAVTFHF